MSKTGHTTRTKGLKHFILREFETDSKWMLIILTLTCSCRNLTYSMISSSIDALSVCSRGEKRRVHSTINNKMLNHIYAFLALQCTVKRINSKLGSVGFHQALGTQNFIAALRTVEGSGQGIIILGLSV